MLARSSAELRAPSQSERFLMSDTARILACPTCKKPVRWAPSNPYRPFCSKRCRLIDFGAWANESHKIPGQEFDDVLSEDINPR